MRELGEEPGRAADLGRGKGKERPPSREKRREAGGRQRELKEGEGVRAQEQGGKRLGRDSENLSQGRG